MLPDPMQAWSLAWKTQEMMAAAAMTIGLRTLGMGEAMVGLRPHDHRENSRMVAEKIKAGGDSAMATARAWPTLMMASPAAFWAAWMTLAGGSLRPYHTRTRANARRLLRKRLTQP